MCCSQFFSSFLNLLQLGSHPPHLKLLHKGIQDLCVAKSNQQSSSTMTSQQHNTIGHSVLWLPRHYPCLALLPPHHWVLSAGSFFCPQPLFFFLNLLILERKAGVGGRGGKREREKKKPRFVVLLIYAFVG